MARHVGIVAVLLLTGCVDLTEPPALQHRDAFAFPEGLPDADDSPPSSDVDADIATPADADDGTDAPAVGPDNVPPLPDAEVTTADAPAVPLPPDAAAPPDLPRDAPPLLTNGSSCQSSAQCLSNFCIDGVCCNTSCVGRCQACDVTGAVGRCTPIPAGDDPDNECDTDPVSTCGRDGTCDGAGNCRKYPPMTVCAPGSCTGSMETAASTCSATGLCQTGTTRMCAGGHTCSGSSCASMCTGDGQCQNGFFCGSTQTCQAKRAMGAACTAANQCASNFCVDSVCCNTACDQTCYACDLAGSVGMCNPIPDGQEHGPAPECPQQDPSTCAHIGGCNGRGACRLYPMGTVCGAQACSGTTETDAPTCDGQGKCSTTPAVHDCGAYLCSGTTCGTTCTNTNQCKTGYTCVGTTCKLVALTKLVVHDTVAANVALWAIQSNFQIGMTMPRPWGETMWKNSYVKSMDTAGNVFLGKQWISVATESKNYKGGPEATITLALTSDVYLIVDDRWGTAPTWLAGWTKTTTHLQIFESSTNTFQFTAYKKTAPAGDLDLPMIGANSAYNYFIIVD